MSSNARSTSLKADFGPTRTNQCSGQFATESLNRKLLTNVRLASEPQKKQPFGYLRPTFDDADAEIDRALQSWDDPQLHAVKQRIAGERQEYERTSHYQGVR